ncbi:ABC transporter substrate-binding protein [Cohnella fermenti]|uniref:Extracellular solute-binding protein n=1 Tax=Cohnella fermenti TaxID=2565925 RepID=A0A4S4C8Z4_9BACL|nr:extracellular solute-binding protein [Cohnella fermenti]THF84464.1 extracellular solute-binding protein [Cohnella fermenti]
MFKLKGTLVPVLATGLMASLLAGCGGNNADNNNGGNSAAPSSSAPASQTASESPSDEPVTLRFASWIPKSQMEPLLAEYKKEKPNVTVDYTELVENNDSDEGLKKLDLLVASGTELDVAMFPSATEYSKRAGLDLLAPLNDLLAAEGIASVTDEYTVDPSIDGQVFALPDTYENYFVLLNKDMLDQAGLAVPTDWTWDDFYDYARKLSSGDGANRVYGTYFHSWPMYMELALLNQSQDNNLINNGVLKVDSPEIRQSLEIRHQMEVVDKSAIPYSDTISQKLAYRPVYFSQKAAMIVTGNWMITESGGSDEFPATFVSAFAPMPANKEGDPSGVSPANGNFMSVVKSSKNQQAAYEFIRWYTTKGEEFNNVYSAWKKQDVDRFIEGIKSKVQSPDMIDTESLSYVIKNSPTTPLNIPPAYQSELDDAYVKEAEKFVLGQQDIETTVKNAATALQKIVDANK